MSRRCAADMKPGALPDIPSSQHTELERAGFEPARDQHAACRYGIGCDATAVTLASAVTNWPSLVTPVNVTMYVPGFW